jgi:hypothetical protein
MCGAIRTIINAMNKVNEITTTKAIEKAFKEMPWNFYATDLINRTRRITGRYEFDSTILRILRRLRQRNPQDYSWVCIDTQKAIYVKQLFN